MFKGLLHLILFFSFASIGINARAYLQDLAIDMSSERSDCLASDDFLFVCGNADQQKRIFDLIKKIQQYPVGQEMWAAIRGSGHHLMIGHSEAALSISGKTMSPLSRRLTNGIGLSAVILMDFDIPETGSHRVGGTLSEWTDFPIDVNFFHELVHARHTMKGTFDDLHAEEQAITSENIYRQQSRPENKNLRSIDYSKGEQIWFR